MCEVKDEAKSKIDRLIEAIDQLSYVLLEGRHPTSLSSSAEHITSDCDRPKQLTAIG